MVSTAIITSGRLIESELQAEFGEIPPAFLPIANRRLFELQVHSLRNNFDQIAITIPNNFGISKRDKSWLQDNRIRVTYVDPELSLKSSILAALSELNLDDGCFAINHGDTLFQGLSLPIEKDIYTVNKSEHPYKWAYFSESADGKIVNVSQTEELPITGGEEVLSGFFQFSNLQSFITALALSSSFTGALDSYAAKIPVSAFRPKSWFDFGHVQSYFQSRSQMTTERAFNEISVIDRILTKKSSLPGKLLAESNWFTSIPNSIRAFTPHYLGEPDSNPQNGYSLKFLNAPSLADLYVFGKLSHLTWDKIFRDCGAFLEACKSENPNESSDPTFFRGLYTDKVKRRLEQFSSDLNINLDIPWELNGYMLPSINEIVIELVSMIEEAPVSDMSLVHGDFCFSNILFDSRSGHINVIDPRGEDASGNLSIYGDQRYDLAKLHHSIFGLYDFIIAGHISADLVAPYRLALDLGTIEQDQYVQSAFHSLQKLFYPHQERAIAAISCSLFLSMLPLHSENQQRQTTLLANAFRLYLELKESE